MSLKMPASGVIVRPAMNTSSGTVTYVMQLRAHPNQFGSDYCTIGTISENRTSSYVFPRESSTRRRSRCCSCFCCPRGNRRCARRRTDLYS